MTEIFFIRHGESESNLIRQFTGRTDSLLTQKGINQALLCKKYLDGFSFDAIFSSPLKRAKQTCETVFPTLDYVVDERITEFNGGIWDGKLLDDILLNYQSEYSVFKNDVDNFKAIKGESVFNVKKRMNSFLEYLNKDFSDKRICVFSHAFAIRILFSDYFHKTVQELPWASNASTSILKFNNGKFLSAEYSVDFYMGDLKTELDV